MSYWRIIFRSLVHHWKINFAVALGVAAATTVLTGALLVGDSVRGGFETSHARTGWERSTKSSSPTGSFGVNWVINWLRKAALARITRTRFP